MECWGRNQPGLQESGTAGLPHLLDRRDGRGQLQAGREGGHHQLAGHAEEDQRHGLDDHPGGDSREQEDQQVSSEDDSAGQAEAGHWREDT